MNIEDLRRIRNKNVAQQNQLTYLEVKQCAESAFKYSWVSDVLENKGQSVSSGLLISLRSIPEQEGMLWYGTWLTITKEFYEFEVLTDRSARKVVDIESWKEVSPEVSGHKIGVGKTPAYIALELLYERDKKMKSLLYSVTFLFVALKPVIEPVVSLSYK